MKLGKRIENYPNDLPYPSYLVLYFINHRPIHVVAADSIPDRVTIVITAYEHEPDKWEKSFEERRPSK